MASEISNINIQEIIGFDEEKKIIVSSNKETIKKSYELKSKRITLPVLTKYEKARVIGERAEQIARGFPPLVDVGELTRPLDIALKELKEKKIPIMIRRPLPNGTVEVWKIDDLIIPEM